MASIRSRIGENMEDSDKLIINEAEAIECIKSNKPTIGYVMLQESIDMAINSLEKQEKIKEAFEMWKAETGGYYGADDETTRFISTLNQILRSDEE